MADENRAPGSIRLTPAGHLHVQRDNTGAPHPDLLRALNAFDIDESAGLFELAARPISGGLPPDLSYWRDFARRALTARCHTPVGTADLEALPPLSDADATFLILSAPPMQGAEYLSIEVLGGLWISLDDWVRQQARQAGGLESFLLKRAPLWRQVGRVCFHLAENKKDPGYPFAFLATYAPRISDSARVRFQPLSRALQEFAGEGNRAALVRLLTPVQRAAESSPLIQDLLSTNDIYHPLAWTPQEAYRFLQEVPLYEESGLLVRVPDWWARRPRPRVQVSIGNEKKNVLGLDAILDFQVKMAVGDDTLSERDVKALLSGGDGLVFLRGQWVEVDREKLSEALAHWKQVEQDASGQGLSFVEGMRLLAGAPADLAAQEDQTVQSWSFTQAGGWLKDLLAQLRSPESIAATLPGKDLRTSLRHYQEAGVRWLWLLSRLGLGACLADDMGLGKTIQVIALLLMRRGESLGPSLIVLPASLLANWKSEIERFAPALKARYMHPSMEMPDSTVAPEDLAGADVVLTTYGMLVRQPWMEGVEWNLVILDEAQAIKNPGARQAKAVKRLKSRARITLTGTPVENRLTDLWSLFDFLCPGLLGSPARFKQFAKALGGGDGERYAPLRALVRPYILRRMKTDRAVITDLPEKTEVTAFCGLTRPQAALYQKVVEEMTAELEGRDGMARRGIILSTLLKLKQVCNHPAHLRGDAGWTPEHSGKFLRLGELCEEIASRQERVLVFTQFREATEPLASFLAGVFGRSGLVLHGGTPVKERQELVAAFQSDDGPPFFVLSLKAGGTGLNLTAASHVIHFDRWWNPAVENQATDRAFRIGQKKNVLVHPFVCQGTVEEKIAALIEEKTAMARDLLDGGGEALLTEMNDEQLMATVALDIDRARAGDSGVAFFERYVPLEERRANARLAMEEMRARGVRLQPVPRIEGLAIARTFWGKAWCDHLEGFSDFENRLPRGRSYVRNGSVCHLEIHSGRIDAKVSGSMLYTVSIVIAPLSPGAWKGIVATCTGKVSSILDLLQGRLAAGVMEVVTDREHGMFPRPREIAMSCTCPDRAVMCKHVAAVLYGVGARLDESPELLFLLRGVNVEELTAAKAEAAVETVLRGGTRRRVAEKDLSEIFGLELDELPKSPPSKRPAAAKKAPRRAGGTSAGLKARDGAPPFPEQPTAKTIKALRDHLGLTQAELAARLDISAAAVSRWERSRAPIRLHGASRKALQDLWEKTYGGGRKRRR